MKRLMVLAAGAGVAMIMFSAGVAEAQGAPNVSGKKYSDAVTALKSAGFTAKVAAKVGDLLPEDDCVVSSQTTSSPGSSFGPSQFAPAEGNNKMVLLSLNCNATLASSTDAGNSVASPEGREAAKIRKNVEWQRTPDGQVWCEQNKAQHPDWGWADDPKLAGCQGGG